ncbi:DUF4238 domain-containing protein [Bacillus thuringiensis]|nr:DUF4238 domain-containing protein [Bacillus thuringiensis]
MVKKQHYVPRFYLKYFANEDKVDYYDKVLEKTYLICMLIMLHNKNIFMIFLRSFWKVNRKLLTDLLILVF